MIGDVIESLINGHKSSDSPNLKEKFDIKDGSIFSEENYIDIDSIDVDDSIKGKKISFIDGGNSELIKEAGLSVQLVRTCCVTYCDNKRISTWISEFFIIIRVVNSSFVVECHSVSDDPKTMKGIPNPTDLELEMNDPTISQGNRRGTVSNIGGIARLFSELKIADLASSFSDYIILDGSLQKNYTNQDKYLECLEKKSCVVGAISKSSELITKSGQSINRLLMSNSPFSKWIYRPIALNTNTSFLKLHKDSKRSFRFEHTNCDNNKLRTMVHLLVSNSSDPVFIGYPYGLVDADDQARVSNRESEYYRTIIQAKTGIDFEINSHSVLDNAKF